MYQFVQKRVGGGQSCKLPCHLLWSELHTVMNERLAARQTAFHDRDDNEEDYRHRRHYYNGDSLRTQAVKAKLRSDQMS